MIRSHSNEYSPYGWRFVPSERRRRDGSPVLVLEKDYAEWTVLEEMRRLQLAAYSYRRIAEAINAKGIQPRAGKKWAHSSVRKILATYRRLTTQPVTDAENGDNQER